MGFDGVKISIIASLFISGCFSYPNGIETEKTDSIKDEIVTQETENPILNSIVFFSGDVSLNTFLNV